MHGIPKKNKFMDLIFHLQDDWGHGMGRWVQYNTEHSGLSHGSALGSVLDLEGGGMHNKVQNASLCAASSNQNILTATQE